MHGPVVQAQHCGLPPNTPLVEQVQTHAVAGAPKNAMQIASAKYRRQHSSSGSSRNSAATDLPSEPSYPEPKMRDQFLEFAVMPGVQSISSTEMHATKPEPIFASVSRASLV